MTHGVDVDVSELSDAISRGERRALAKGITLVESTRDQQRQQAEELLERLLPLTGRACRVGLSGAPGVGKSTFLERLGVHLLKEGHRVAVLAIDPSSARSGGSLLADKTRMPELSSDARAFVRPSPAGRALGGTAAKTRESMVLCEAAGYDVVIVETVGVGQSEHAVRGMVDYFLLLLMPGAGDELQGLKRGIVELVDGIVVNKADGAALELARDTAHRYSAALQLLRGPINAPCVLTASALHGDGVAEAWRSLATWWEQQRQSGELERRRAAGQCAWFRELVEDGIRQRLYSNVGARRLEAELQLEVAAGRLAPSAAARRLLALLG
jgi:LAO/AO transport system kinase